MERLNYQHLYYFWMVAREQSVTRASEKLHLTQPTISNQIATFEQSVGARLFLRTGRNLTLSDTGRLVFRYAEEIFSLGRELTNAINGRGTGDASLRLTVGITDAIPKLVAYRLIEPAMHLSAGASRILCYEDKAERLLSEISLHNIDLVLSDSPLTPDSENNVLNHFLGESSTTVFGTSELAYLYRGGFPRSLGGAPFLLPTVNNALRRSLDQWFDAEGISPRIQAEIEDSALLKTFGSAGVGLFAAPTVVRDDIERHHGVLAIGQIDTIRERFYAMTARRKLKHPVVMAILERAHEQFVETAGEPRHKDK